MAVGTPSTDNAHPLDSVREGQPAAPIDGIKHFNAQTVQELASRARSERPAPP